MSSASRALSKLAVPQTGVVMLKSLPSGPRLLLQASRRTVSARPLFGSPQGPALRQFRRGISSDAAPVQPPKKRRFRKLRWAWRFAYLSAIAGIVYIGYGVYQDRHPEPQVPPDPSKKTLVILGKVFFRHILSQCQLASFVVKDSRKWEGRGERGDMCYSGLTSMCRRNRLGLCLTAEEAGYREL